jgi:gluconolactonase
MKLRFIGVTFCCVLASVLAWGQGGQGAPQQFPREVTVTEIPGVVAAGAKWQQVWQGLDNADGILGLPDGTVIFAQEQPSTVRKLDKNDYDSAFIKDTHGAGSLWMDSKGRIIVPQKTCTDPGRGNLPCTEPTKIAIIYPEKERKVLVDKALGKPLQRPSEVQMDKKGNLFFTDNIAYYVKASGGEPVAIGNNLRASGIMLSTDEKTLYIGSGGTIYAFDIQADGSVANQREFGKMVNGNGNSMAIDGAGRLYVTSGAGVQVFSPEGKHLGTIPTPRNVVAAAFAGPDKKTLYVVGSGAQAPNGKDFTFAEGFRNNGKTIYKIPMLAQGFTGRPK